MFAQAIAGGIKTMMQGAAKAYSDLNPKVLTRRQDKRMGFFCVALDFDEDASGETAAELRSELTRGLKGKAFNKILGFAKVKVSIDVLRG